jgi:hypothetical protein
MLKNLSLLIIVALGFTACEPNAGTKTELGALPVSDFSYTMVDSNTIALTSESTGDPFLFQWGERRSADPANRDLRYYTYSF